MRERQHQQPWGGHTSSPGKAHGALQRSKSLVGREGRSSKRNCRAFQAKHKVTWYGAHGSGRETETCSGLDLWSMSKAELHQAGPILILNTHKIYPLSPQPYPNTCTYESTRERVQIYKSQRKNTKSKSLSEKPTRVAETGCRP